MFNFWPFTLFKKKPTPKVWVRVLLSEMYCLEAQGLKPNWQNFLKRQPDVVSGADASKRKSYKRAWKFLERNSTRADRYNAYLAENGKLK